jgi:LuxR family glucitol operon transcriptional activator
MAYSAARLTLFATLSAVEADLRDAVVLHLDDGRDPRRILGDERYTRAQSKMRLQDGSGSSDEAELAELLAFTDFLDPFEVLRSQKTRLPEDVRKSLNGVAEDLPLLAPIRNRVMHRRPLEFDDLSVCERIASRLVSTDPQLWRETCSVAAQLADDPSWVFGLDIPWQVDPEDERHNLPIPDFDETGYLGRGTDVESIKRSLLSPQWPVVTIIGEGGVGKSATALRVAYDLLYDPQSPYEHIVWTTSKTTKLVDREIASIEGAIRTSLGMFSDVSGYLAPVATEDPAEEVLSYLETFPILLIVDNVETILDDTLRGFFSRIPQGSKVLVTSRIGLGAFEFQYRLNPLAEPESARLLRTVAQVRGVTQLARTPNDVLRGYCARMSNNPAFIKWFVSAVQSGRSPELVLAQDSRTFLEFCMANVYEYLSGEACQVLHAFLAVPEGHTTAELAVLTELQVLPLQKAVQQLMTTCILTSETVASGSTHETAYDLTDLARDFIRMHHPIGSEETRELRARWRRLAQEKVQLEQELEMGAYGHYKLCVRSRTEAAVAKILKQARAAADAVEYGTAEDLLKEAAQLAPNYFEVDHMRALIRRKRGDHAGADDAYRDAIQLEASYAPLHRDYAVFLMMVLDELDEALEELLLARRIDGKSVEVLIELARCYIFMERFDDARTALEAVPRSVDPVTRAQRDAWTIHALFFTRLAEARLTRSPADYAQAAGAVTVLGMMASSLPAPLARIVFGRLADKALLLARQCAERAPEEESRTQASRAVETLAPLVTTSLDVRVVCSPRHVKGRVKMIDYARAFGFIVTDNDAPDSYFNVRSMVIPSDFASLSEREAVYFVSRETSRGWRASDVLPVYRVE